MSPTQGLLLFLLGLLVSGLAAAPLFVDRLKTERVLWAKREANRKLYEAVNGKVLVPRGDRFDIIEPNPGIIPDGTVVFIQPSAYQAVVPYGIVVGPFEDDEMPPWRFRDQWMAQPVITRPQSFIPPSVS